MPVTFHHFSFYFSSTVSPISFPFHYFFLFFFSIPLTFHFCPFLSFPCSNLYIPLYRFLWLFSNHYIFLFIVLFCSLCAIALFIFFIFFFPPNFLSSLFLLDRSSLFSFFSIVALFFFFLLFRLFPLQIPYVLAYFLDYFCRVTSVFLFLFVASSSSSFFLSVFLRYFSSLPLSFSSRLLLYSCNHQSLNSFLQHHRHFLPFPFHSFPSPLYILYIFLSVSAATLSILRSLLYISKISIVFPFSNLPPRFGSKEGRNKYRKVDR